MRWGKRISHLLILILLCVLIFYAGIYLQIDTSGNTIPFKINATLLEKSGEIYLTRLFYEEEDVGEWMYFPAKCAMNLLPIGEYVNRQEQLEVPVEDEVTYEMILSMQAEDENEVDENGKLIKEKKQEVAKETVNNIAVEKLYDYEYLISNFYTIDGSTSVTEKLLDAKKLLKKDMAINKKTKGPKVLIYHTHSQEAFRDSEKGNPEDTIMGMGKYLSKLLNEKYGIETIHHEGVYDLIDGQLDRSKAYQLAEPQIVRILEENPTIEVVIDLHRDGVRDTTHLVTEINGKKTAQFMFFNGLSRTRTNGDIAYLHNPYIAENLAFSLQMQIEAMERYPGLARRIYLKSYRYNMHLMPKTLLIEAGAQTNTVKEMKNSMVYLAEILDAVLTEEKRFD